MHIQDEFYNDNESKDLLEYEYITILETFYTVSKM